MSSMGWKAESPEPKVVVDCWGTVQVRFEGRCVLIGCATLLVAARVAASFAASAAAKALESSMMWSARAMSAFISSGESSGIRPKDRIPDHPSSVSF